jgi:hypothetical protein
MKCPICKVSVKNFKEHAFGHVRADEAYAVETWNYKIGSAKLVLHPLAEPPGPGKIRPLQKKFDAVNTRILTRGSLRMLERRHKAAKRVTRVTKTRGI